MYEQDCSGQFSAPIMMVMQQRDSHVAGMANEPHAVGGKQSRVGLLHPHGGYRTLRTYQLARLVYDLTKRFCDAFVHQRSRTHDQMVQAARSGVQNIAEASKASATSARTEIKLTNVARASLEELRLDYEDFLRQRKHDIWSTQDARRRALVARRCSTADEVVRWVTMTADNGTIRTSTRVEYAVVAANAALVLIGVTCALLDRQLRAQIAEYENNGGFTERMTRVRQNRLRG